MNKYNFKSYKVEALWLRIESFFNNIIYLEWSLNSFCLSLFDFTQTFIKTTSLEFQTKTTKQGKFYLFSFFGIANHLIDNIDHELTNFIRKNYKNSQNNINLFNKDFEKWLKIVEDFSKTKAGKNLMILIEQEIKRFQQLIAFSSEYKKSLFLKTMHEKGKKIYFLEKVVFNNIAMRDYKILSIDKNYFQKRKN